MKRFISSVLTLGMLLTPSFSLAEFTKPSELFMLMSTANLPIGFSGELHGNVDDYWFAAWINGSTKGTNASNALVNMKGTFDIAMKGGKARVKFQMRVVNGNLYFYVDSIDGTYEDALWKSAASLKTKTWIKIELPEELSVDPPSADYFILDEILNITSRPVSNGTTYELSLTREAVRDMLKSMRDMEYSDWDDAFSALPRTAKFNMTINTDKADGFVQTNGTVEMASKKMSFDVKGSAWVMPSLVVTAPKDSMSMEEWTMSLMDVLGGGGYSVFGTPVYDSEDTTSEEEWSTEWEEHTHDDWEEYTPDEWEDSSVDMIPEWDCRLDLDAVRHGECDTFERTPRRLP